jgi:hypothetical protein
MTVFGTPFRVAILSHEHWLSTWPMTLRSKRRVWYMEWSMMAGASEASVCGVWPGQRLSFSLGVHATLFQAEIFAVLACLKEII